MIIGPTDTHTPLARDERNGMVPPAWWRGDEYASRSGITAMTMMKRSR